tara:strand:+ start:378 stop:872 length:495 start_codon:yes stop_codon:yes gene_type:complete
MNNSKCPVPKEQQPTNEFLELSNSKVFSLPKSIRNYLLVLILCWSITFLIFMVISSGSVFFKSDYQKYILLSLFTGLSIPLLINIRLYLGWIHIYKRLSADIVEYEESGWYDGQIWNKPSELIEKERLIANLEVKPILINLKQSGSLIFILILTGILILQNNIF